MEIKEGKIVQEYYRTRRLDFNKKQKEEYIAKTNMLLKPGKKIRKLESLIIYNKDTIFIIEEEKSLTKTNHIS